jgi:hypothetical protein
MRSRVGTWNRTKHYRNALNPVTLSTIAKIQTLQTKKNNQYDISKYGTAPAMPWAVLYRKDGKEGSLCRPHDSELYKSHRDGSLPIARRVAIGR